MTIKELHKRIDQYKENTASLAADRSTAEAQAEAFNTAAIKAAQAGDREGYRKNREAEAEARERAFILKAQLDAFPPVSQEEALSAWANYTVKYNKEFRELCSEYYDLRNKLCDVFDAIADKQNEGLKTREWIAGIIGAKEPNSYDTGEAAYPGIPMPETFPITAGARIPGIDFSCDTAAYVMFKNLKHPYPEFNPQIDALFKIFKSHRSI